MNRNYLSNYRGNTLLIEANKWRPAGINDLETAAWKAVRSHENTTVIAGPGAGKTELLAQRACYLLQTGIVPSPRRILAISFKRDAATNLKDRVSQRCDVQQAARLDSFTFDAFAKSLLDRFRPALPENWRPSADYEVLFTKYRNFEYFLDSLDQPPSNIATIDQVQMIRRNTFEKEKILGVPLPEGGIVADSASTWAASRWWIDNLRGRSQSSLTFPMIGRLVELLIRTNPKICEALRATYSHVFLDEFQDTTHVQYDLVKTIFGKSCGVLTAVGDNKQQIMRWAMALDDPFKLFESDFDAKRIHLVSNYRSTPDLVRIQHEIAIALDPQAGQAESKVVSEPSQDACSILEFATPEDEANCIAELLSLTIERGSLTPRDFAVLVKQRATQYANELVPILLQSGVRLRDEGGLQDILAERLTGSLVSVLRCGSLKRAGRYWTDSVRIAMSLRGLDPENYHEGHHLHESLGELQQALFQRMKDPPASPTEVREIMDMVISFLGEDNIKLLYPVYQQGNWYTQVLDRVIEYLFRSCQTSPDWPAALDDFEGKTSVPLMTIHKSKGLEYHTVIFLALDDQAWWSFPKEPEEARSAFFVAFSRAKQKVVFTYCRQRAEKTGIAPLYELLQSAGVPTYEVT